MKTTSIFQMLMIPFVMILCACEDTTTPKEINKEGLFVTLPGYLKEDELSTDAIIEYANRFRNFYVAGFAYSKSISSDSLWTSSKNRIVTGLKDYKLDTIKTVDGSKMTKITGHFKDEKEAIIYSMKQIEGKEKNYLLTTWIRGEQRYKRYEEDIAGILKSVHSAK